MKYMKFLPLIAFITILGVTSCSKKEGCTNQSAVNYDPDAHNDDGSCIFDEDNNNNNGNGTGGDDTQTLSGTTDNPLTLENIYEDESKIDYIVDGTWWISAAVTVEPGVRIVIKSGGRIQIQSDGSLDATGTAAKPIHIVGEQNVEGFWDYMRYNGSNNPNNKLIYTYIHNGGGNSTYNAAVYLSGNSRLIMQNSSISKSDRYGLFVSSTDGRLIEFENNTFETCGLHPIKLRYLRQTDYIDFESQYNNNTYNTIHVDGNTASVPFTVKKASVPYLVDGTNRIQAAAIIEPGVHIQFGAGARLQIDDTGSLTAVGTAGDRITIEGNQQVEGYWDYIRFNNSNNTDNNFQFCDVSHGGGNGTYNANIYLSSQSYFRMGNSSVNFSARDGIDGSSNATFVDDGNNTYQGNELDDNTYL